MTHQNDTLYIWHTRHETYTRHDTLDRRHTPDTICSRFSYAFCNFAIFQKLPRTLDHALAALRKDTVLMGNLGDDIVKAFLCKKDAHVEESLWELSHYELSLVNSYWRHARVRSILRNCGGSAHEWDGFGKIRKNFWWNETIETDLVAHSYRLGILNQWRYHISCYSCEFEDE